VVPAEEQPGRHHVQRLEVLMDPAEHLLEIRKHRPGELIDQERAGGVQQRVRLPEDDLSDFRRNGGVRYAGNDVIGMGQIQRGQRGIGLCRRAVNDVQPVIVDLPAQEAHEIHVGL